MSHATLIRPDAYRVMPWRNGLGTTTEIAIEPLAEGRFRWRLSIADVAVSGPFSDFAGYDRVITVASGAGMRLAVAGRAPVALTLASAPYAFSGDAATVCTLIDGPIRDFNLMTERASCRGTLTALHFAGALVERVLHGGTAFLHALRGAVSVAEWTVPEGATLRLDGMSASLAVAGEPDGVALLAEIRPLSPWGEG